MQEFRSELESIKKIMDRSQIMKEFKTKMEIVRDNIPKNIKRSRYDLEETDKH